MLKVRPAWEYTWVSIAVIRSPNSRESCLSRGTSTAIPALSIRARTEIKRPLELGIKLPQPLAVYLGREDFLDSPGCVGVFAGVFGNLLDVNLVHAQLVLAFADQLGDRDHVVAEKAL